MRNWLGAHFLARRALSLSLTPAPLFGPLWARIREKKGGYGRARVKREKKPCAGENVPSRKLCFCYEYDDDDDDCERELLGEERSLE